MTMANLSHYFVIRIFVGTSSFVIALSHDEYFTYYGSEAFNVEWSGMADGPESALITHEWKQRDKKA